jgi:alpha-glucosidase (family GH31 glycosyl hydrolase)
MLAIFTLTSAQQFFLHNQRGEAVLRPMWVHYSEAEGVNEISDQFMVGFNLIIKPVLEKGAT